MARQSRRRPDIAKNVDVWDRSCFEFWPISAARGNQRTEWLTTKACAAGARTSKQHQ